ncbi:hypothetical protein [Methylacidimicrobium cyclopophantes]|nr:hypothetical protein [Methylacidimicrobium cyclopophantes]
MKLDLVANRRIRIGWLLLGMGILCVLTGLSWQWVAIRRERQEREAEAMLEKRVAEARVAVAHLREAALSGEGLSEAGRRFQDCIEELSLPEAARRGIAREAAWNLLQKAANLAAEASVYRREEPDHPYLAELLSRLRALRTEAFPLLTAGLPPAGIPDAEQCRPRIFYAKGLLDAWIADLENDTQRQVESWFAAVSEMEAALREAPEDPWTIENLEVLGSTFYSTLGHAQVKEGEERPSRKEMQNPAEAPPLPQRQGHSPAVSKGKM